MSQCWDFGSKNQERWDKVIILLRNMESVAVERTENKDSW